MVGEEEILSACSPSAQAIPAEASITAAMAAAASNATTLLLKELLSAEEHGGLKRPPAPHPASSSTSCTLLRGRHICLMAYFFSYRDFLEFSESPFHSLRWIGSRR
jgi:hypothetical protein